MTIYFIDPSAATNGTGSFANPMNTLPPDYSIVASSDKYLLKNGTTFVGQRSYGPIAPGSSDDQRVIFGSYGDGPKARWVNGAEGRCLALSNTSRNITVRDIDFYSDGLRVISSGSTTTHDTATNFQFINLHVSMSPTNTGVDRNGLMIWGANTKVLACVFEDIATDAIWCNGDNVEIAYCKIRRVASDTRYAGDCIQMGGTSGNPDLGTWIHHNELDHSSSSGKQCFVQNSGTATVEYNKLKHQSSSTSYDSKVVYFDGTSIIIRGNYAEGANNGLWVQASGDGSIIESNLVFSDFVNSIGIVIPTPVSVTVQNNTVLSLTGAGKEGINYFNGATGKLAKIINNIVGGFSLYGIYINESDALRFVNQYNILFNNATATNRAHASNILANPRLNNSHIPQELLARLSALTGATKDLYGDDFSAGTIGAIQPTRATYNVLTPAHYAKSDDWL